MTIIESARCASIALVLLFACGVAFSQDGTTAIPETVPANAYLNGSGRDWNCERGFRREDERCIAVSLPPHSYLDYSGSDWRCESGFRKQGATCAAQSLR